MRHNPTISWISTRFLRKFVSKDKPHLTSVNKNAPFLGLRWLHQRKPLTTYTRCVKSISISHLHQIQTGRQSPCVCSRTGSILFRCPLSTVNNWETEGSRWILNMNCLSADTWSSWLYYNSLAPSPPVWHRRPERSNGEDGDLPGHTTLGWYRCTRATSLPVHWNCCRLLWGLLWIGPLGWGLLGPHQT